MVKANYDGAVLEDSGEAGIEVVFQNACGEVMAVIFRNNSFTSQGGNLGDVGNKKSRYTSS